MEDQEKLYVDEWGAKTQGEMAFLYFNTYKNSCGISQK